MFLFFLSIPSRGKEVAVTPEEGFLSKKKAYYGVRGSDGLTAGRVLWAVAFPVLFGELPARWFDSALVLFGAVPNVWLESSALNL